MNGKSKRWTTLILVVYGLAAVVMTWPVSAQLGTHLPGGGDDVWVHQWTFWWVKESIVKGYNPLYTHLLFHPEGVAGHAQLCLAQHRRLAAPASNHR